MALMMSVRAFGQYVYVVPGAEDSGKPGTSVNMGGPSLSIYDLLSRVPSINIQGDGTVTILGEESPYDDSSALIDIDGMETYDVFSINPDDVYSIEVIRSSRSALYGLRGAHGVIKIVSRGQHFIDEQNRIRAEKDKEIRSLESASDRARSRADRFSRLAELKKAAAEKARNVLEKAREFKDSVVGTVKEKAAELKRKAAELKARIADREAEEAAGKAEQEKRSADEAEEAYEAAKSAAED